MVRPETIRATFTRVCGVHFKVTAKDPEGLALARSALVTFQPLANPSIRTGCPRDPTPATLAVHPALTLCPRTSSNGARAPVTWSRMAVDVFDVTVTAVLGWAGGAGMSAADTGASGAPPGAESRAT